jgi:outer membrane receptor protein involved in Fe transport
MRVHRRFVLFLPPALFALAAPVSADIEPRPATVSAEAAPPERLEDLTVTTRRPYTTAGSEEVRARDFELRPKNRPADLLRLTPGLMIAQHQGGGKAEQLFLRGFDADHGTDVALFLDDLPLNLRSHAHGQGYADEHWIIPETVEKVTVLKGPYDVSIGDFATAGSVRMVTRRNFAESSASLSGGMWNTQRYVAAASRTFEAVDLLGAFEYYFTDGPFKDPQDYSRWNGLAKATLSMGARSDLSVLFTGYSADWFGSGEIPERAVKSGKIRRFGAIDPTEGGKTERFNLAAAFRTEPSERDAFRAGAYYSRYRLDLWNDFTFFLNDPVNGDEIEQNDRRHLIGGNIEHTHVFSAIDRDFEVTGGLDSRTDLARVRLGTARRRKRLATTQVVDLYEASYGAHLRLEAPLAEKVRTVLGGRGDYYHYEVDDRGSAPGLEADGTRDDAVPGATANLIFGPFEKTEVYLNFGMGHHSNDARAVVREKKLRTLPKLLAYEIGARSRLLDDRLDLGVSAFFYDLESELVLVGDEGSVEPRGRTRRFGIELEERLRIFDWLFFDGEVSYTEAYFVSTGEAVPLAPRLLGRAGLTARASFGLEGSLQMRHVGERYGIEDRSERVRGYTVFDLFLRYRYPKKNPAEPFSLLTALEAFVTIENLFDAEVDEAQFVFVSRLPGEPPEGVLDRHFTPGLPFTVTGGIAVHF